MIPKECKRLAEVDFPIAVVSKHAAREKSIRHGHPSTLHLWWARRPLAACRAMLLALLLPDPCDENCPDEFKKQSRELLPQVVGKIKPKDQDLRHALLKFIGDFANWDFSTDRTYLEISRGLVKAAHGEEPPLVVDPFAGGGSIPLEALRLGCDVLASDLNPVACLLSRTLLEDIPRHGNKLLDRFKEEAVRLEKHLIETVGNLYPTANSGSLPTAYLWARVVQCEASNCGVNIPLLRSLWLSRGKRNQWALKLKILRPKNNRIEIQSEVYKPEHQNSVGRGTVSGGNVLCPACSTVLPRARVEAQLRSRRGGTDSAELVAIAIGEANRRTFAKPSSADYEGIARAVSLDQELSRKYLLNGQTIYPDEQLNSVRPSPNARGLSAVTRYGITTFSDCFLPRQRVALASIGDFIRNYHGQGSEMDSAVKRCLLIGLGRCVDRWSSCCRLDSTRDTVTGSFSKQALQLVWDFCEANPFSKWSGGLGNATQWVAKVIEHTAKGIHSIGQAQLHDSSKLPLPSESAQLWFTDPPYYDSVPYADLSDFFYCWLRRANLDDTSFCDPFDRNNQLTPKLQECVWNQGYVVDGKPKDPEFFENCVRQAFSEAKRIIDNSTGIGCVVFAHKTTEGWEALLMGLIKAGFVISSSWPIQTEMKSRTAARDAASLMGSIHLVCRPRFERASVGDWGEVYRELPIRVGDWIERLQAEGVRGADLVFACIGPAMEIYSRYSKVEDAEGREIPLGGDPTATEPHKRGFLAYVWETVGRLALQQVLGTAEAKARNGAAGALEEDARLTALFLWTLQSTNGEVEAQVEAEEDTGEDEEEEESGGKKKAKGYTLIFDVVRRFAQPLGIHLDQWEGRIIETEKGIVRLLPISERAEQLFGEDGASAVATRIEQEARRNPQMMLEFSLPEPEAPAIRGRGRGKKAKMKSVTEVGDEALTARREATTLDRVHAAMLLQSGGRANALRALLKAEQERGPDFLRLCNALTRLYPKEGEEKRLLDAMLLAVPR
ncbi:MAG: DUF1156 domain-containing protein [Nitrospiraceae bacterium]